MSTEYNSISEALAAAIREVAGKVGPGQGVTLTFQPDEALGAATDIDRLVAEAQGMGEFAALKMEERDAAEAKLKALREAAANVLQVAEDSCIDCSFCSKAAMRVDRYRAFCDEHIGRHLPGDGDVVELDHASPLRALRALLEEP